MEIKIDRRALERRSATCIALRVLEAAISHVFGFPLSVQRIELWASPALFDEDRTPERYVTLPPQTDDVARFAPNLTKQVRKDMSRIRRPVVHDGDGA